MNAIRKHRFVFQYLLALSLVLVVVGIWSVIEKNGSTSQRVLEQYWAWQAAGKHPGNAINIVRFAFETHNYSFLLHWIFAGAPTIAAIVVCALAWGRAGVRRLFGRLKPWNNGVRPTEALKVYGVIVVVYLAVFVALLWSLRSNPDAFHKTYGKLGGTPLFALVIALVGLFIDEGGMLEELGWRGFAMPQLQDRFRSPAVANLLLGFLWFAWHFPRELPTLFTHQEPGKWALMQLIFCLYCISLAIVMAYAVNRTGGSVLPAIMIHSGPNVWAKTDAMKVVYDRLGFDFRLIMMGAIAILLVAITRGQLGRIRASEGRRLEPAGAQADGKSS